MSEQARPNEPQASSGARAARPVPPELLEWLFTLAAIAFLFWQSEAFREPGFRRGAGERYQEAVELKATMLPLAAGTARVTDICMRFGGWLPASENEICRADLRHLLGRTGRTARLADRARTQRPRKGPQVTFGFIRRY